MKITKLTTALFVSLTFLISNTILSQNKPPIVDCPYPGYTDLFQKAQWLQEDLHNFNSQYGIVIPRVPIPTEGNADLSSAHQENGGNRTGLYLAH